jgi:hypothetical protein
VLSERVA